MRIEGVVPALVTPLKEVGGGRSEIDWQSWERLVDWQLARGVHGLVLFGTTGESATLTKAEKLELARRTVQQVGGRIPLIAGTGSNNTAESVEFTKAVAEVGVDAALAVTPYYNKPSQEGIYAHFSAIAQEGGLPLILYNVPGRTVSHISLETYQRLAEIPQVIACKHAVDSISELLSLSMITGEQMTLLAGDDPIFFSCLCVGGRGVISATASVFPDEMLAIWNAYTRGAIAEALAAQQAILPAIQLLFSESNPCPAKAALKLKGIIAEETLRLPLLPVQESTRSKLRSVLQQLQ